VFLQIYQILYKAFGPQHWWPGDTPLEINVGAVLTQNTAWTNVEKAIANLKKARLLNLKKLYNLPEKRLATIIRPAGYFNVKAKRLKNYIHWIVDEYGSLENMYQTPVARLREELLEVNGLGPETVDSILLYGGNKRAFVIDAYTKRIFYRHYLAEQNEDYHTLQEKFVSSLPKKTQLYNEYHGLIVNVGKNFCKTKTPLCSECPLQGFNWGKKGIRL